MKILQNPVAVSILGLVAAGLLFKTTVYPIVKRSRWYVARGSHPAAAPAKTAAPRVTEAVKAKEGPARPAGTPGATGGTPPAPLAEIDMPAVMAGSVRWMQTPRRDPFKTRFPTTNPAADYLPAMQQLTLQGICRQSGSTLAVLNNHIMAEGDIIKMFKITSIEQDRVWVLGPNGREAVDFQSLTAPPPEALKEGLVDPPPGRAGEQAQDAPVKKSEAL